MRNFSNYNTYETEYGNFPLKNTDLNSDNYVTIDEAYQRTLEFDSNQDLDTIWWGILVGDDPQLNDNGSASTTTIAYTDIITSNISTNKTYKGIIGINKDIHVTSGNTLTLGSKARLEFVDDAKLIVDAGATLVLNEATFVGNNSNNKIQVYGTLQASNNSIFKTENSNDWGGVVLCSNSTVSLNNCTFQDIDLTGYANSLTLNNCAFDNSYLAFSKGNLTVQNSNFSNTQLRATSPYSSSEVIIDNCEISDYNYSAIYINGYNKYSIEDCSIHDNGYNGIYVYNAGSTSGTIKNNSITSNGTNNHAGIRIYNSYADIELNEISDNRYGVMCLNGSNTSIKGYQFANYPYETQQIVNNEINQIYTSSLSFPDYLRYNKISDSYNPYYKVYYDGTPSATLDVRYNNWGRFNTSEDLYPNPSDYYEYFPLWFFTIPQSRISMAEKTYNEGLQEKNNKNYDHAEKNFKKVIEKYSDSPFAIHSLKELMAVESLNKENYKALKEYLLTEKKIQQDKLLEKLAGRLANRCDIKLKNYRQAIEWFEKVIENSETLEDSVFAIIDLAETYFLMQNDKNSFVGKRAEFKFESFPKFEMKREELIDLLMAQKSKTQTINQETTENKNEKETENTITPIAQQVDFKVFPNPIKDEAHFQYQLNRSAQVCIKMFDYSGKEIAIVENSYHEKGFYEKTLNTQNIKPGIYFYSFELNGKTIQTKKIIITN